MQDDSASIPPSQPEQKRKRPWLKWAAILFGLVAIALYLMGALRPYSNPSRGMSPAIDPGDNVVMEGVSYFFRAPRRGEIVVFKTDRISRLVIPGQKGDIYLKRLVGLPGDQLRIAEGKLFVNGKHLPLENDAGPIVYTNPTKQSGYLMIKPEETVVVPEGNYFVLGDNSPNSADSRYWGFVPAASLKGRLALRFWPLNKFGPVK